MTLIFTDNVQRGLDNGKVSLSQDLPRHVVVGVPTEM